MLQPELTYSWAVLRKQQHFYRLIFLLRKAFKDISLDENGNNPVRTDYRDPLERSVSPLVIRVKVLSSR